MTTDVQLIDQGQAFLAEAQSRGMRTDLQPVKKVLAFFGNPQDRIDTVHIAGSNGKGSTGAILESIFSTGGYCTGWYTSPHLAEVNERIKLCGRDIADHALAVLLREIGCACRKTNIRLTYFEILTCTAFIYFYRQRVHLAIIETGMGGRWDATNVLAQPRACILTAVSPEHTRYLGSTIGQILREKTAIIRDGTPVVSAGFQDEPAGDILKQVCVMRHAPLLMQGVDFQATCLSMSHNNMMQSIGYRTHDQYDGVYTMNLLGQHQAENAGVAISAAGVIVKHGGYRITRKHIADGLVQVRWPGRFQKIVFRIDNDRTVQFIVDGAHNPAAMRALADTLRSLGLNNLFMVMGILKDKDYESMIKEIIPLASAVRTFAVPHERGLPPDTLAGIIRRIAPAVNTASVGSWEHVFDELKSGKHRLCLLTGSLYLVGDFLRYIKSTTVKFEIRNPKHETNSKYEKDTKYEIRNTKFETNSKHEIRNKVNKND